MIRLIQVALLSMITLVATGVAGAERYAPARVVYDFSNADPVRFESLLDRVSLLQNQYSSDPFAASIVVVIHEGAIPVVANRGRRARPDLIRRARDLSLGHVIQFRLCQASAGVQGYTSKDFDDFIEVVPMADAEIVRLQHDGHAYIY